MKHAAHEYQAMNMKMVCFILIWEIDFFLVIFQNLIETSYSFPSLQTFNHI